jgi:2,4-dienoyl-CoA reductase-like NADH-dependent reductase (Old Yellow Enzyme family)
MSRSSGFQVMEIHAAHGYLLHQFSFACLILEPTNMVELSKTESVWREVVVTVQSEWPENLRLFVRISATDWAEGGWNAEESIHR